MERLRPPPQSMGPSVPPSAHRHPSPLHVRMYMRMHLFRPLHIDIRAHVQRLVYCIKVIAPRIQLPMTRMAQELRSVQRIAWLASCDDPCQAGLG